MLEQFKTNAIFHFNVEIVAGASPKLLSLLPELLKVSYYTNELTVIDEHNNRVKLNKPQKYLKAVFHSGERLTLTLPSDYIIHHIVVHNGAIITAADLEYIAQWKNAEILEIIGVGHVSNFDVALPLLGKIDQLKKMKRLREFIVSVYSNAYKGFEVKPFVAKFPFLKLIILDASTLTQEEFKEIAESQTVPGHWFVSNGEDDQQQVITYENTDSDDSSDSSDWAFGGYN